MLYDHFDGKTTFFKASDADTLEIQNSNPEDLEKLPRLFDNRVPSVIAALVDKVKAKGSNNKKIIKMPLFCWSMTQKSCFSLFCKL